MEGTLFKYGPGPAHVAFKSGSHPRHVVVIGGLTDGLLFSKYVPLLDEELRPQGVSVVQTLLTSSHQGWGLSYISRDVEELGLLLHCLKNEHHSQGVVLLGQSTGCQDAVATAALYKNDLSAASIVGVVLQAPVSDREWLATQPDTAARLHLAQSLVDAGRSDDVAFRAMEIDGAAVTASRWLSLAAPGGEDDMFSSDLSDAQLAEKLSGLQGVPTLLLLGSKDEYVPASVDYLELGNRMARAIGPTARLAVVEGGNHGLHDHAEDAAGLISAFVTSL